MKKSLVLLTTLLVLSSSLFAQGASEDKADEVYFLNFKPEVAEIYTEEVAPAFEAETGIKLKVVTAASGSYAQTLKSEMAKSNPPAIFQTNGPIGLAADKDNAMLLSDTKFYSILGDKSMALQIDNQPAAIPYAVEGYGIIYNDSIMEKYFNLSSNKTGVISMDEINNFDTLKAVVEDMQANKDKLGIKGVFASTSMSAGNDWRWQTHLVNVPLWAEFAEMDGYNSIVEAGLAASNSNFKYSDNYKALFDLYLDNSTVAKTLIGAKSVDDSMAEFALGQCAMVQNGNWGAGQILGVSGNKVDADDIKFIPLYMGLEGEESQGLCVGTENYLCINNNVSDEAKANADEFLYWLFASDTGKKLVQEKLGFITPFNTFTEAEMPSDPLAKDVIKWMNKDGVSSVPWAFAAIPSQEFKNNFGADLLQYAQGQMSWNTVVNNYVTNWASEYKLAHN
ncbi:MAG: ABC transporter substrate-binding protein [Pleomorphochaeta sp.]